MVASDDASGIKADGRLDGKSSLVCSCANSVNTDELTGWIEGVGGKVLSIAFQERKIVLSPSGVASILLVGIQQDEQSGRLKEWH